MNTQKITVYVLYDPVQEKYMHPIFDDWSTMSRLIGFRPAKFNEGPYFTNTHAFEYLKTLMVDPAPAGAETIQLRCAILELEPESLFVRHLKKEVVSG